MHILIASRTKIPVVTYGGTERVIWDLGLELVALGHKVTYLVSAGSHCDFAGVIHINEQIDLRRQLPPNVDVVHFHFCPEFDLDQDFEFPYVYTEHGNSVDRPQLPLNAVFLSHNHAQRHGSNQYVYNGLDWRQYGPVDFNQERNHLHFLGKAAWRVKNVAGAIDVALKAGREMSVLGGDRLNIKRGFRYTFSRRITFHGMVGGETKFKLLNSSFGLIFPVRWHEPFGLAVIESLYFGCAVFGTPYGALPEIVSPVCGTLASSADALVHAIKTQRVDPRECHMRAVELFSSQIMCKNYLAKYDEVTSGAQLNSQSPQLQAGFRDLPWSG
jgi:glycosyltransferase involved in cell wall biosynthesis